MGVVLRIGPPRLTVAGRTDAGVHARGQVVHCERDAARDSPQQIGKRGVEAGTADLKLRSSGERFQAPLAGAAESVVTLLGTAP